MALNGTFQYATVATNQNPVLWSGANSQPFDGYVLILLAMPAGYSGTNAFVAGFNPVMPLATAWRFFITNGMIDQGSTIPYTSSLEPPNTQYAAFWYDLNDVLISTATGLFTVTTSPLILSVPTLTAPVATNTIPTPGAQPSGGGGGITINFGNNVTPSGTIDGINTVFTLPQVPNPANSLTLFQNGVLNVENIDYTLSGPTVTFVTAPLTGAVLRAFYQY